MANITATMVKALRDATQQGMMECKKALQEADGDIDAAKDILRKKGLVSAEKRAARTTSEGLVAIRKPADNVAVMVELLCETDFCARNDEFKTMVAKVADLAAAADQDGPIAVSDEIADAVQACLAKTGENMSYSQGVRITATKIGSYLHHNNKVGVLVGIEGDIEEQTLADLCMHIAFADPVGITVDDIPADIVEKEKKFALEQAVESGKPQEIAEKMVAGKMRKFLAGKALLEQPFVRDDKKQIKDILGDAKVTAFARFAIG